MLMGTASVQTVGLHLGLVLGIPTCCAAPARHLRARTSAAGLKRDSFGIVPRSEEVPCSQSRFETLCGVVHKLDVPMSVAIKIPSPSLRNPVSPPRKSQALKNS